MAVRQVPGGLWRHATLTSSNHETPPSLEFVQSSSTGLLLRRSAEGTGHISTATIQMQWQYSGDVKSAELEQFIGSNDVVDLQVHAIEMVYVPQGAFYLGDGNTNYPLIFGHFRRADSPILPFLVTSDSALTLGGTSASNLSTTTTVYNPGDDFNISTTQLLPEAFPVGYNPFYMMKYEITQEQYVKFLNSLTRQQQQARVASNISGPTVANTFVMSNGSVRSASRQGIRSPQSIGTPPVTFFCDMDADNKGNEYNDGQNVACNFLSADDTAAYLDWAGLRPMTEMEYEKACRGPVIPVPQELAWGTTHVVTLSEIIQLNDLNTPDETPVLSTFNFAFTTNNALHSVSPCRVGMFAKSTTTREQAGAAYYGAMEMSGNVFELVVSSGNANGRAFTGTQGNGALSATGHADVADWPTGTSTGLVRRCVILTSAIYNATMSSRMGAHTTSFNIRAQYGGGRGALNAQEGL